MLSPAGNGLKRYPNGISPFSLIDWDVIYLQVPYLEAAGVGDAAPLPISMTYGDSRDHRPDLKQFGMNLVCWSDGAIPGGMELADGNQSDKPRVAALMQEFKAQWHFEGLYVADSALYSEENLPQLAALRWLTRVPLTLTIASELVNHLPETAVVAPAVAGDRIATVWCNYGGVQQRWFVVESQERQQADLKQLAKPLSNQTRRQQPQMQQVCTQAFACEAAAWAALKQFEQKLVWHELEHVSVKKNNTMRNRVNPDRAQFPVAFLLILKHH